MVVVVVVVVAVVVVVVVAAATLLVLTSHLQHDKDFSSNSIWTYSQTQNRRLCNSEIVDEGKHRRERIPARYS
jgi:hypothetical protein